jgi:hypothetical protein
MNCPFCQLPLSCEKRATWEQWCGNFECQFHKMPRYIRSCDEQGDVEWEKIIVPPYYVAIDYESNQTTIYRLEVCIISDPVKLPRALKLNLLNYQETLDKLKLMVILS